MKPKISKHKIEEFLNVIPVSEIERILGKRESKQFWKYMQGQTISLKSMPRYIDEDVGGYAGIYRADLERFLKGNWDLYD